METGEFSLKKKEKPLTSAVRIFPVNCVLYVEPKLGQQQEQQSAGAAYFPPQRTPPAGAGSAYCLVSHQQGSSFLQPQLPDVDQATCLPAVPVLPQPQQPSILLIALARCG